MNITLAELTKALAELTPALDNSFVNKVTQIDEFTLLFGLRRGDKKYNWLLSLSPKNSRAHLVANPPEQKTDPSSFLKIIKKSVIRSLLSSIRQENADRIIRLDFGGGDVIWSIVAELTGTRGNIYLLDKYEKVVAIGLHRKSRNSLGQTYIYPPTPSAPPDQGNEDEATGGGPFVHNIALEEKYAELVDDERLERARAGAMSPLNVDLKKTKKRINELRKKKEELEKYRDHKSLGDILQSNFHLIRKGKPIVTCADPATGDKLEIAIDPALNPSENVNRYYKLHRKYVKGGPRLESDMETVMTKRTGLMEKIDHIKSIEDINGLTRFLPAQSKKEKLFSPKQGKKQASGPRRFVSSDGYVILVGRSDRENDELSFKIANGRDLWLHARDYPGSHAIVQLPRAVKVAPPASLREAAMIALKYSKAAKAGKGEVTWCHAKNVRRIKGAPPGKVSITHEKSINVRIDEELVKKMKERALNK